MARPGDGNSYTSAPSANSPNFTLMGGNYMVSVVFTGAGSVELQYLGPDSIGFVSLPTPLKITTSGGTIAGNLPAGTYRWTVTTVTAIFANARRIPND